MTFSMTPAQITKLTRQAPWYFLGGVGVIVVGFLTHPFVTITGFTSVMLGAGVLGFKSVIKQPLMWIVSSLLWLINMFIYVVTVYLHVYDVVAAQGSVLNFVALSAQTAILWLLSRWLFTFTQLNWNATQRNRL